MFTYMYVCVFIYIYIYTYNIYIYIYIDTTYERRRGPVAASSQKINLEECGQITSLAKWIPFGDHPLKLERYRED